MALQYKYQDETKYELGMDEAGRGPLFGRLYVAAVVMPLEEKDLPEYVDPKRKRKEGTPYVCPIRDSKKFTSETKIKSVEEYIKRHALAWAISYVDHDIIDQINIRQAVFRCMHDCCRQILSQLPDFTPENALLLVDGNDFKPFSNFNAEKECIDQYAHTTIEGGDNKYISIAAASILAKVARDEWIYNMCQIHPDLHEKYGLSSNKGYGTKKHIEGIHTHGPSPWHRTSFKIKPSSC